MPSSMVIALIVKLCTCDISDMIFSSARESFPPDTATATSSPFPIMPCFDMVFATFLEMELEKHAEQRSSPEYALEYAAVLQHLSHFMGFGWHFH